MVRLLLLAAALLSSTMAACTARPPVSSPNDLMLRYAAAVESGDLDGAYEMLSAEQRRRTSREEFLAKARRYPEELRAQAEAIRRAAAEPLPVTAVVPLRDGEEIGLLLQGRRWRLSRGVAGATALTSPLEAVRAFRRGLQRRSYAGVMRTLGQEARAQIEDEIARIIEGLEDEDGLEIQITGTHATVTYDEGHRIELERESGQWVIVDMN